MDLNITIRINLGVFADQVEEKHKIDVSLVPWHNTFHLLGLVLDYEQSAYYDESFQMDGTILILSSVAEDLSQKMIYLILKTLEAHSDLLAYVYKLKIDSFDYELS